jgi:hypothetical protein
MMQRGVRQRIRASTARHASRAVALPSAVQITDVARCVSRPDHPGADGSRGPRRQEAGRGQVADPIGEGVADVEAERPLRLGELAQHRGHVDRFPQNRGADGQVRAGAVGVKAARLLIQRERPAVRRVQRQRGEPGDENRRDDTTSSPSSAPSTATGAVRARALVPGSTGVDSTA